MLYLIWVSFILRSTTSSPCLFFLVPHTQNSSSTRLSSWFRFRDCRSLDSEMLLYWNKHICNVSWDLLWVVKHVVTELETVQMLGYLDIGSQDVRIFELVFLQDCSHLRRAVSNPVTEISCQS